MATQPIEQFSSPGQWGRKKCHKPKAGGRAPETQVKPTSHSQTTSSARVKDGFWDEVQVDEGGDQTPMPSVDKYLRASSEPGLFWEWAEGRDTKLCPCDCDRPKAQTTSERMDPEAGGQMYCEAEQCE